MSKRDKTRAGKHTVIGKRVQIPAYTDDWMKGDRFGEVVNLTLDAHSRSVLHVMLDKSNRTRKFLMDDCEFI